jgi:hypothetical protein
MTNRKQNMSHFSHWECYRRRSLPPAGVGRASRAQSIRHPALKSRTAAQSSSTRTTLILLGKAPKTVDSSIQAPGLTEIITTDHFINSGWTLENYQKFIFYLNILWHDGPGPREQKCELASAFQTCKSSMEIVLLLEK